MGKFLKLLRAETKKLHKEVGKKPYLARYKHTDFDLPDHYYHLYQLRFIYSYIENKMQEANYKGFNEKFAYLLERSKEIIKDHAFICKIDKIDRKTECHIRSATTNYLKYIKSLDMENEEHVKIIFAHFIVRILGDLFGGQRAKKQVTDLYVRKKIRAPEDTSTTGVDFYSFPEGTLNTLLVWLDDNVPEQDIATILEAAKNAFKWHMPIFDELEKTRIHPVMRSFYSFFGNADNQRKMAIIAAGTAGLAAGFVVSKVL